MPKEVLDIIEVWQGETYTGFNNIPEIILKVENKQLDETIFILLQDKKRKVTYFASFSEANNKALSDKFSLLLVESYLYKTVTFNLSRDEEMITKLTLNKRKEQL